MDIRMKIFEYNNKNIKIEKVGLAKEVGTCLRHQEYTIWDPEIDYETIKEWHKQRVFGEGQGIRVEYHDTHIRVIDIIDSS